MNVVHLDDDTDEIKLFQIKWKKVRPLSELRSFTSVREAESFLDKAVADLAFVDQNLGKHGKGTDVIARWGKSYPGLKMVLFSSSKRVEDILGAWRVGAIDYLPKGEPGALEERLPWWETHIAGRAAALHLKARNESWALVGSGPWFHRLQKEIEKYSPKEAPVYIEGESGTGKELVARALHTRRSTELPFVAVNCAGIPESLAESFLFGHEKGAFTGADQSRMGVFEEAKGGTVFLDEINSLSLGVQAKLLRVLQEREVRRVGGSRLIPLSFRLVCASNRPLEREMERGRFREDLYHRIQVLRVELPPLRDRPKDIELLIHYFYPQRRFTEDFLAKMKRHSWPGNVRELQNVLARADALSDPEQVIDGSLLPPQLQWSNQSRGLSKGPWKTRTKEFEYAILAREYETQGGNVTRMAHILGVDRSNLHQKLVRLGIHKKSRPRVE